MITDRMRAIIGWIAVGISTLATCFWAFWGIIENFHEGWYFESTWSNLGLMIVQYLSPMLLFMVITVISIFWPRLGAALHVVLAVFAAWFFQALSNPVMMVMIAPLIALGCLYWFGRPMPRKVAAGLVIGLPILVILISGISPLVRVSKRYDDGILHAREVIGNGVTLTWAPEGPGWPRSGANWYEARRICQQLSEDGLSVMPQSTEIWRLPSADETVRSMTRNGENSGGIWDPVASRAAYINSPDKESPLWNVYSQVIYWWTATEVDEEHALIIVYDGNVWRRSKQLNQAYLGFRCVRDS